MYITILSLFFVRFLLYVVYVFALCSPYLEDNKVSIYLSIIRRNATSEDTARLSRVDAYDLGCTVQSGQSRCGATKLFNIIPVLAIP